MQSITILGATGSIGESTLAVISQNQDQFHVRALTAGSNVEKMFALCQQWQPEYAVMSDETAAALRDDV
ncbi:MAG: 1-deoxy-D-xylulose-5-phosphate reductoisomerase, partial [Vibrio sp.]